uniref:Uncharacterized protein n=1 Tax=Suricata suricatta TaxID=37032 RepID=A0A673ULL8_SURSU
MERTTEQMLGAPGDMPLLGSLLKKPAGHIAARPSIHNGVIAIFQRKGLPDQELFSLNEGVRQLLKTELGSFLTEYLQVGGPSPPAGRGGFPRPGGPGSPALGGYVEPRVPRTLPPHDSVSPSVQRGSS